MPQERWSIAEKMERELREGREDRKPQEMHRLPRRHLGAWAETVHRVELKGWTRALPEVPWGMDRWADHSGGATSRPYGDRREMSYSTGVLGTTSESTGKTPSHSSYYKINSS